MREVDEQVRKDQAADFWNRWGLWLVGGIVLALAAFGGWLYWSNSQQAAAEAEVQQLAEVLQSLDEGGMAGADEQLAPLSESSRPGVRAAALLMRADIALQSNDIEAAIGHFAAVAGDEDLPQPYRDLALIRQTAAEYPALEPQTVIDRLAALTDPESRWFGSAGELTAIALMRQGNDEAAGALWAQMAAADHVPETIRTRAIQMAGVLGVDAVPDEPVDMDDDQNDGAAQQGDASPTETGTTE